MEVLSFFDSYNLYGQGCRKYILEMCPQIIQLHRDCLTVYIYIVTTKFN